MPIGSLGELDISLNNDTNLTNINTISDRNSILPSNSSSNPTCDVGITGSNLTYICSPDNTVNTGNVDPYNVDNAEFKSKKYSIQKIFDNNNE